ncbi:MAG TPA: pyridoxal phosphate-dependent aminotransferase [Candidatus Acidoferrales bacterium]|nr:pyridoxal phosphate-dependent aminotransferase [Candidatus Acidoferrales bacterium]
MAVKRLANIPGFSIDLVAAAAGNDPEVLRLENLDTDLPPPPAAIAATQAAIGRREANSYLPFSGSLELRTAVANRLYPQTGHPYSTAEVLITCGATEGMLDALLATTDPGDEVILTDPTYAGMINRVRLVGAIPRFAALIVRGNEWRLDMDALRSVVGHRTRVMFIMNPAMPSGAVLNRKEWELIAEICQERSLWLIYNAAMERILFEGRDFLHPAALPGMLERTITIGSVSKEYRMIGWRVGWVVGPETIVSDIARVHIYNVVTPTGIAQAGALAALKTPPDELDPFIAEWQRRRDTVVKQLQGYPIVPAAGGWSLLLSVAEMGLDSFAASRELLERGKVAATPMRDWGQSNSDRFVRLVFSNEPVERLSELRHRVNRAFSNS